jgi:hypothetical protein
MLTKINNKDPIILKFDTSFNNLACFIRAHSKLSPPHRHNAPLRKRTKSTREKCCSFRK